MVDLFMFRDVDTKKEKGAEEGADEGEEEEGGEEAKDETAV